MRYSKRLVDITGDKLQRALDRFDLGRLQRVEFVSAGHFGQNLFVTTSTGRYVFRGNPIRHGQFAKEQFFARVVAHTTSLESPWPYLHDPATDVFGWEYAFMPRLVGEVSTDPALPAASVPPSEYAVVAFELGVALAKLQAKAYFRPASFDTSDEQLTPFAAGYQDWARSLLQTTFDVSPGLSEADRRWIARFIDNMPHIVGDDFRPVLCHADFHNANVLLRNTAEGWQVTGIIDLSSCHIGHPESDLARQFCLFAEKQPALAREFLRGYDKHAGLIDGWRERLTTFIMYDRLKFWEWGKRKGDAWWDDHLTFRQWCSTFLDELP